MRTLRESNMDNGVDLIHQFSSVKEAVDSGRFDFIYDEDDDNYWTVAGDDMTEFEKLMSGDDLDALLNFVVENYYFFSLVD